MGASGPDRRDGEAGELALLELLDIALEFEIARVIRVLLPDSSPSKTPGIPTKSIGMPSSASASMFRGCSLASLDANPVDVYCPLARPVLGMSRSFGGHGGGGSALEYRMRAM